MSDLTPEQEWHHFLSGTHPEQGRKSPFRFIPSSPRCRICAAPFHAPGALLFRRYGFSPWEKNPNICKRCFSFMERQSRLCPGALEDHEVAGAEVEVSMLFADVRGSSDLARQMSVWDFTRLMNRFYTTSSEVLIQADAIIEKFVGDAVVGLFLPFMTGQEHARRAVDTAEALMRATGHGSAGDPWVPIGIGVHTGTAFVGMVGIQGASEFTALGDPVNIAAHLAAQAAIGEILLTREATVASGRSTRGLEERRVSLKGHAVDTVVLGVRGATTSDGSTP